MSISKSSAMIQNSSGKDFQTRLMAYALMNSKLCLRRCSTCRLLSNLVFDTGLEWISGYHALRKGMPS